MSPLAAASAEADKEAILALLEATAGYRECFGEPP